MNCDPLQRIACNIFLSQHSARLKSVVRRQLSSLPVRLQQILSKITSAAARAACSACHGQDKL